MTTYYVLHASPLGELMLVANATAITALTIIQKGQAPAVRPDWLAARGNDVLDQARGELDAYFAGALRTFTVPLAAQGSAFAHRAWAALAAIPYGETRTYAEQARAIGQPTAARAVGAANGRNPLGIIVPCHRVIGAGGTMTGYAGGLQAKRFLLDLEASRCPAH